jgi:hypothetical protein
MPTKPKRSGRMNETTMKQLTVGLLIALVLSSSLVCSTDRWIEVEPGEYVGIDIHSDSNGAKISGIDILVVDRESDTIVMELQDGSPLVATFVARQKQDWPVGCPSNIGSTRMEVLDIQSSNLSIGGMTFNDPILVRNCPPSPNTIVLLEDGTIGGAGSACAWPDKDIHFGTNDQ